MPQSKKQNKHTCRRIQSYRLNTRHVAASYSGIVNGTASIANADLSLGFLVFDFFDVAFIIVFVASNGSKPEG